MKKRSSSKNIRKTKYANPVEQQVQLDKHRPLKQVETLTSRLDLLKQQYRQKEHNVIVMQERITQLMQENQALNEQIRSYQIIQQEYSQERIALIAKEQQAYRKTLSYEKSMSFRLGYAIIFGFKSFAGFKQMLKTIVKLFGERGQRKKSTFIATVGEKLREPVKQELKLKSQKPLLQWQNNGTLRHFSDYINFSNTGAEIHLAKNSYVKTIIDCGNCNQLILGVNAYSKGGIHNEKQALLTVTFFDEEKKELKSDIGLAFSERLKTYYFYLNVQVDVTDEILLSLPKDCVAVEIGFALWDAKDNIYLASKVGVDKLSDGVSIILPTYQGRKTIKKCLDSLRLQTLEPTMFEVLVIMNGPADGTEGLLNSYQKKYPDFNMRIFKAGEANVSKARNLGIEKAVKTGITFIDDDDYVHEDFLVSLYDRATYHTMSLTGIEDIYNEETRVSSITAQLDRAILKNNIQYADVTSILTMNACKLAPTHMVKTIRYDPSLRSGEDVVYWSDLLLKFHPKITLVDNYVQATYKRVVRDNSVSRQKESYDFNVWQRLEVINQLNKLIQQTDNVKGAEFVQTKITAQSGFIKRYLEKYPQDYTRFSEDIEKMELVNKVVGEINSLYSDTLVVSYCFAPFIDTSGVVMSKRIRAMGKPVDIIFNNMDKVRPIDEKLMTIANRYLGKRIELNAPQAFSNWGAMAKFSDLTLLEMGNIIRHRAVYKEVYSRAMWPASHFAAAAIKMKYPQIKWSAEFSDPLLMDVSGKPRFEAIDTNWLEQHGFVEAGTGNYVNDNLFYWCEMLPYQFADELIFTNENQLEYMLSYADSQWHDVIRQKSVILPQPTLEKQFYEKSDIELSKKDNEINLAYFGSFYVNRGFGPFMKAWEELDEIQRNRFKLHIYTQQNAESILEIVPESLKQLVVVQPYVGYFEFLKLSNQFDGLIVMDAETASLKLNNPYLPSKLSDYLGSDAKTLAMVEEGSPMSKIENEQLIKMNLHSTENIKYTLFKTLLKTNRNI